MFRTALLFCLIALPLCGYSQAFVKTQVCYNISYGAAFDVAPDGRFFITQKGVFNAGTTRAQVKIFDASGNFLSVFCDLSDSVDAAGEFGLLGIALDPHFSVNHYVYTYYTHNGGTVAAGNERIIIARFTEVNNIATQPAIIFDYALTGTAHSHVGGNIHFRPSDTANIYVSIGDLTTGYSNDTPARLDNPLGKILRISKNPNAPPPSGNPFYDDGDPYTGNCDWIWAYGLRNSYDFCFAPNDSLYATENGTQLFDEVNLITRGGFYGWPLCEGSMDMDTNSLPCHAPNAIAPLVEFPFPVPALTGIIFYTGTAWGAQQNHLITADYNHADLTEIFLTNAPAYNTADSASFWIDASDSRGVTDIWQGPDGCIYTLEFGDSLFGGIYKICPEPIAHEPGWSLGVVPNPFHESGTVHYSLAQATALNISLFDARGRRVAVLVDGTQDAGPHSVDVGAQRYALPAGMYICRLHSAQFTQTVKVVVE